MMRNKNKHLAIANESTRKATLEKRRDALFKKVQELSTLCDVQAGVIVQDLQRNEEFTWPSHDDAREKVMRLLSMPEISINRKMATHDNYLLAIVNKKIEEIKKIEKQNDEKEMKHLMNDLTKGKITINELDIKQTNGLTQLVLDKMNMLDKRIEEIELEKQEKNSPLPMASPHHPSPDPVMAPSDANEAQGSGVNASTLDPQLIEALKDDQWFMDTMFDKQNIAYPPSGSNFGVYYPNVGSIGGNIMGQSSTMPGTSEGSDVSLSPPSEADSPTIG